MTDDGIPCVLIVAENASTRMGGEAAIPLHYFRQLFSRGAKPLLVVHQRCRVDLRECLSDGEFEHVHFTNDTRVHRLLWRLGSLLPARIDYFTLGFVMRQWTQREQRNLCRQLIAVHRVDVVHQPTPVSPREPSGIVGLGRPVVIGPMNGGMTYPPGLTSRSHRRQSMAWAISDVISTAMNAMVPGKRRAAVLIVANGRTEAALPRGSSSIVVELVENGVDSDVFQFRPDSPIGEPNTLRIAFLGRLVDWKFVDLLLEAVASVAEDATVHLDVVGDGPERGNLEALARSLGLNSDTRSSVQFHGWRTQRECADILSGSDALALPSVYECGGAVVLEAMAMGLPVIATRWGGPADYLDASCGILVDPSSRSALERGFAAAIESLAKSPQYRRDLGAAAADRVRASYLWEGKVDRIIEIYRSAVLA